MSETSNPLDPLGRSDLQLLLDADIVEFFEKIEKSEDLVNEILRTYMEQKRTSIS